MQEQPNPFGAPIPDPSGRMNSPIAHSGVNDSGTGGTAVLPAELRGFNWGAFLLNWIWSIGHSTWIGLLCFVPFVGWIMSFVLGFKGNEWAWQNRKWDSVEHFRATQKAWTKWGVIIVVVSLVLWLLAVVMAASTSSQVPTSSFPTR